MKQEFRLQDPGEGVQEVDVLDIMIAEGDEVSEGQEVLAVESDKAAVELPSPFAGRVVDIRVAKGDTVNVGDVLLIVEDGGAEERDAPAEDETSEDRPDAQNRKDAEDAQPDDATEPRGSESPAPEDDHLDRSSEAPRGSRSGEDKDQERQEDREPPRKASPAAREAAKEAGLEISEISPTGTDGQVTVEDVEKAEKEEAAEKEEESEKGEKAEKEEKADKQGGSGERDEFGPVERHRVHSIRAATARAMSRSWREIPHAVHHDEIDITEIERWRRRRDEDGGAVSLTAIVIKAVATLLPEEPRFNATYDAEAREIVERGYVNINVAVATDHGLVTPVIKAGDRKTISDIDEELAALAERARDRSLSKSDLSGGTFTLTNVGAFGGRGLVPIINPPQTAILGLARAALQPVVTSGPDEIENPSLRARMILPIALAFDHRGLDGADAARFAGKLGTLLSEPLTFALET